MGHYISLFLGSGLVYHNTKYLLEAMEMKLWETLYNMTEQDNVVQDANTPIFYRIVRKVAQWSLAIFMIIGYMALHVGAVLIGIALVESSQLGFFKALQKAFSLGGPWLLVGAVSQLAYQVFQEFRN